MRRKLFVTFLLVLLYHAADAQTVILHVTVKTPAKDSSLNATIQLYSLPDTVLIASQVSNADVNTFSVNTFSKYFIKVSAVGYEAKDKTIAVTNKTANVIIELKTKSALLNTVVVTSKKPLIKQEDDKTIVDAEVLANSSTSAYEVLEKTPGAVVDQDGNVYLNSSTPATIYINGRQMRMSTDDIASLLKSLPAGSVSKIEIIRTPSAKYDAANSGGIVNVVLKKGIKIGTTGSVNARYDQGVYGTATVGFSLNSSVGKVNSYVSYQYTNRKSFENINSTRLTNGDTLLSQSSFTKYKTITNYIGGGVDVQLNKKLYISYDMRLSANSNHNNALSTNNFSDSGMQNYFYQSNTPIITNGNSFFINNTLSSKYLVDSLGSTWTNEVDYTYNSNNKAQSYTDNYTLPLLPAQNGNGTLNNHSNFVDFKSDLAWQLKHKFLIETGFKISDATNKNNALYYIQIDNMPQQVDPYQTNTFTYKEDISSAYLQLSKTWKEINFKAGLRLENTSLTGVQTVPTDTSFSIKRNDLFPYFYIKRPLFKIFGYPLVGNAIFRRSITRPGYGMLNPSPEFIDPFTYNVGNPALKPQFTTNYELNATYNDFPVFAIGTNNTKDIFSSVTYQNDTTKIAYRTFDNLGSYKEVYGRLFGGLPAGGKYFMYVGAQYNHIEYNGTYEGKPLNYSRGSWTFFTGHELKVTSTLKINLHAWMYVNGFRAFNELKTLGQATMSVTKTFMDKKLSVILSGNDILNTNVTKFHLQQANVLVNGTRTQDTRRIGLTIRYNFGIAHKEEKKELFQQPVTPDSN